MTTFNIQNQFMRALGLLSAATILPKAYADNKPDSSPNLRLPLSAMMISVSKHDFEGAAQLMSVCASSISADYLFNRFIFGKHQSWSPDETSLEFCGASYLQSRYGNGYGVPALSIAASIDLNNPGEILPRLLNIFGTAAFNFIISDHLTNQLYTDRNVSMSVNERGDMQVVAPNGLPTENAYYAGSHNFKDGEGFSKPKMNLQLNRDENGKVQGMFNISWGIR